MKRFALLLCFLVAACGDPGTETASPPGPAVYRQGNGGSLVACKPIGFDTICRGG